MSFPVCTYRAGVHISVDIVAADAPWLPLGTVFSHVSVNLFVEKHVSNDEVSERKAFLQHSLCLIGRSSSLGQDCPALCVPS